MSKRAGVYLRISQDRTGEGAAVDRQREDCLKLVGLRGWTVAHEFSENDVSASGRKKRPQFERLLEAVEADEIDVIVAWALDRLGRNRRDHLRLMEACQQHRVSLALVRGSDVDMTSAIGRGFADMMSTFARLENEQKSERQRRQVQQATEAGLMGGGPRAFGWAPGGLEFDPTEVVWLRNMYEWWLAGAGLREIADRLHWSGVLTTRGKRFRPETVRVVLENPRNAGLRAIRPIVDERTGRRSVWHDPPIAKAVWPEAVPEEVWRAALARLRDPMRPGNGPKSVGQSNDGGRTFKYLLSGLAVCGRCGGRMITGMRYASNGENIRTYHCVTKMHFSRKAEHVEGIVVQALLERLSATDAAKFLLPETDTVDLRDIRRESLAKRTRLAELAGDYADGVLDRDQMRVASERLRARLAELDALIAEAGQVDVVAPLVAAEDPWEVWESYPTSTQRLVVTRLMRVTVMRTSPGRPKGGLPDRESIKIEWVV